MRNCRVWLVMLALCFAPLAATAALIPQPPDVKASAWILLDSQSGHVLAQHDADKELEPASLTKLMTAYIVEQQEALGNISASDMVPISVKAWRTGGSRMFVREGTRVKLDDLMHGLVIQSGNDAAVALAEYVAGSTDAFANMMNNVASNLGMTHSHFENPTGLPHPDHFSSARDLATLAQSIIHNYPKHYKLYSIKKFTYNGITQHNRVTLLWRDPRVDGLKTGHTKAAGYCQVTSAKSDDGMRLIAVVMGTASTEARAVQSEKLLNYGFRFFTNYSAYQAGKTLVSPRVWLGKANHVDLGIQKDLVLTVPNGAVDKLKPEVTVNPDLKAPIKKGQQLGSVSIQLDGKQIAKAPLVAMNEVKEAGWFSRLWDHIVMFFSSFID